MRVESYLRSMNMAAFHANNSDHQTGHCTSSKECQGENSSVLCGIDSDKAICILIASGVYLRHVDVGPIGINVRFGRLTS